MPSASHSRPESAARTAPASESPLESNRGVGRHRPLAQDQFVQAVAAYAQFVGHDALPQAERTKELLQQHLARVNQRAQHCGIARQARWLSGSPRTGRRRHRVPPIQRDPVLIVHPDGVAPRLVAVEGVQVVRPTLPGGISRSSSTATKSSCFSLRWAALHAVRNASRTLLLTLPNRSRVVSSAKDRIAHPRYTIPVYRDNRLLGQSSRCLPQAVDCPEPVLKPVPVQATEGDRNWRGRLASGAVSAIRHRQAELFRGLLASADVTSTDRPSALLAVRNIALASPQCLHKQGRFWTVGVHGCRLKSHRQLTV